MNFMAGLAGSIAWERKTYVAMITGSNCLLEDVAVWGEKLKNRKLNFSRRRENRVVPATIVDF